MTAHSFAPWDDREWSPCEVTSMPKDHHSITSLTTHSVKWNPVENRTKAKAGFHKQTQDFIFTLASARAGQSSKYSHLL